MNGDGMQERNYLKSVRQFDRFVDMALSMAISNFGDLKRRGQTGVKYVYEIGTSRSFRVIKRSITRKKSCSVNCFATGIGQTNFRTSRMTLTQF